MAHGSRSYRFWQPRSGQPVYSTIYNGIAPHQALQNRHARKNEAMMRIVHVVDDGPTDA